jgi:hypothetical protein
LTVVRAMGDGKKAAVSIDAYIKSMAWWKYIVSMIDYIPYLKR